MRRTLATIVALFALGDDVAAQCRANRPDTAPGSQACVPALGARTGGGRQVRWRGGRAAVEPAASPDRPCRSLAGRTSPQNVATAYVERVRAALGDEMFARDTYAAAAGVVHVRRFAHLARAEQNHVDALAGVVAFLGGAPVTGSGREVLPIAGLVDAGARQRAIERDAIARFDALLADCPDPGVRAVLERLQAANRRHLARAGS